MIISKIDRNCTLKIKKLVLDCDGTEDNGSSGITFQALISLSRFDWSDLIVLNMCKYEHYQGNNKLGAKGCKFLSIATLPKL